MKHCVHRLVLLLVLLGAGSCSTEENFRASAVSENVALQAIQSGALLVDVRTPAEFAQGNLEGSINISHQQVMDRVAELGDDMEQSIVVYCRSGNRSGMAKVALEAYGFTRVINGGGYENLKRAQKE